MSAIQKSEDEYGRIFDRFSSNCIIKMGAGLAVGSVFSLVLFRRRGWPIYFSLGTGLGFALSDLQHDLNTWGTR